MCRKIAHKSGSDHVITNLLGSSKTVLTQLMQHRNTNGWATKHANVDGISM